jgi:alpha-beta hydrolase superfamily lysophospholipase
MPKMIGWLGLHPKLTAILCLVLLLLLLNLLAYRHARAMTHFVPAGRSTRRPEVLSRLEKVEVLLGGVAIHKPQHDDQPDRAGLAYDPHAFPGEAGRLEAWYVPHRQARGVVLMFHGYTNCKAEQVPEARAFHDLGYACFLVDFRGSGNSEGNATTVGYFEADDVSRAVRYVRQNWPGQPLILFGQSMGSAAILRAIAVKGVEADAVVVECPFDRLVTTVEARFLAMGLPAFPGARLLVFWGGLQHGFNGFRHNPVDYARSVKCPVLLLHGKDDARVSCAHIEAIYNNLAGEKDVHYFVGIGHESYVARKADEWKERVGRFLENWCSVPPV